MTKSWRVVALGEVLSHRKQFITINDTEIYRRPRVQLHARGIVLRDEILGARIKTKRQQVCRSGEFLVAEIDAKVGGFGVVPNTLDGSIVSSHYFLFSIDTDKLERRFLDWFVRTATFRDQVEAQGSTNYAAIRPDDVLHYKIPSPPLAEQQRLVMRIEELDANLQRARTLRCEAREEARLLIRSTVSDLDNKMRSSLPLIRLKDLAVKEKGSLRSGPFGSALLHHEFVTEGVPAVGIQDVQENRFVLSGKWNVSREKADELKRYTIRPRDLLVTVMGTLGRACAVPEVIPQMISTKHVWTISLDQQRAEPRWISFLLNYSRFVRDELLGQQTGTAIAGLNGDKLRNVRLPDASLNDQRRALVILDDLQANIDSLTSLQSETAAELDALLPAILDRAFKGEL